MRKPIQYCLILSFCFLTSCATIFTLPSQKVAFESNPPDAVVTVVNKDGKPVFVGSTPTTTRLFRGRDRYNVFFYKEGYLEKSDVIDSDTNHVFFLHTVLPPFMLVAPIDKWTGAMWKYPKVIDASLQAGEDTPTFDSNVPQKPFTFKQSKDAGTDPLYPTFTLFISGNMNWVGGFDAYDTGALFDYGFGFAADVRRDSSPIIGGVGIRYSRRGYSLPGFTQTLAYYESLFRVKYDMYQGTTYSVHPYLGVTSSVLMNTETKWDTTNYTYHRRDYFQNVAAIALLGVDVTINNLYVIGLEYNLGLTDVTSSGSGFHYTVRPGNPSRLRSIMLNLGIKFDRKPKNNNFW